MTKRDGPVSRYLNRKISSRISSYIIEKNINITPNQVTLLIFLLSLVTTIIIIYNKLLLGGILIQFISIADGIDGEIARARNMASRKGAFLDTMLDRYSNILFIIAIVYSLARNTSTPEIVAAVGLLCLSGDIMVSYLHARGVLDLGVHPSTVGPLDSIASRDVRLLLLALSLVFGVPFWGLVSVGVLSHIYVISKFVYLMKFM